MTAAASRCWTSSPRTRCQKPNSPCCLCATPRNGKMLMCQTKCCTSQLRCSSAASVVQLAHSGRWRTRTAVTRGSFIDACLQRRCAAYRSVNYRRGHCMRRCGGRGGRRECRLSVGELCSQWSVALTVGICTTVMT
jgi:hypothetical protein